MNDSNTEELRLLRQELKDSKEKARLFEEVYQMARGKLIAIGKILHPYMMDISPKEKPGFGIEFSDEPIESKKT